MSGRWSLTDLEFVLLCDPTGHAGVPDPFTFTSRTELAADYEVECARVLRALRERDDSELWVFADAVARPDVSLALRAWNEREYEDAEQLLRVHAVRSRTRGYVITQRPGETVFHSGGFDVVECDPHAVPEELLGALPFAAAGRCTAIPLPATEHSDAADSEPEPRLAVGDEREDDDARTAEFLSRPADRVGDLVVYQGRSKFGPRGRVGWGLEWRDLPGDGRYVVRPDGMIRVATGMGTKGMVEWLDEQIAEILLRLDRHMENEE
ncbi:ESX secretion-associated protein EspG [Nocardia harenae]|uniref:ESX secretion-associated protein EspG n=1 Tax=Nocardia harenae TaxID=358707 RepID=UPI00082C443E|nr:ESX secretion-associated protein EspG [Nocardia harenae]